MTGINTTLFRSSKQRSLDTALAMAGLILFGQIYQLLCQEYTDPFVQIFPLPLPPRSPQVIGARIVRFRWSCFLLLKASPSQYKPWKQVAIKH